MPVLATYTSTGPNSLRASLINALTPLVVLASTQLSVPS
jgi:hypothetical protein